jgi:inhibitor of cysteine peptidase
MGLSLSLTMGAHASGLEQKVTSSSKPILVTDPDGNFIIRVMSNPSTGYSWFLVHNPDLECVKPTFHQYIAPNSRLIGAPGYEEWHFRIEPEWRSSPQVLHVMLQYLRPWVGPEGKPAIFTVVVAPLPSESTLSPHKMMTEKKS